MQYTESGVVIQGASGSVQDHGSTKYGKPTLSRAWTGTRVCIRTLRWRVVLLVLVSFGFWKGLVEPMESPGPYHQGPPVLRRPISELKAKPRVGDEVRELVIVPGRAVYVDSNFLLAKDDSNCVMGSDSVVLEGQAKTLTEHMESGIKEVANNPNAIFLFAPPHTGYQRFQRAHPCVCLFCLLSVEFFSTRRKICCIYDVFLARNLSWMR